MHPTEIHSEAELLEKEYNMVSDPGGLRAAIERIEMKLDQNIRDNNECRVECAKEHAVLGASTKSAHKRLDAIDGRREAWSGWRFSLAAGVILAVLGTALTWLGKWTGRWVLLLGVLTFAGCGTPESVRQTNRLNGDAARWIVDASPDPAIDRAAKNIADGSAVIERKIGAPENPPVYTPETHEKRIVDANRDLDQQEAIKKGITGWIEKAVTTVADFVMPGLGGILVGAYFWLRKKTAFDKVMAGARPIVKVLDSHPEIQTKIADYASKIGAGAAVKSVVDALKK